jgi:hypothetical protein
MTKGDKFIWLHNKSSHLFGLECECLEVRGDLIDYKFVGKEWSSATMPLSWATVERKYSEQEISAIRAKQKRSRLPIFY